MYPTEIYMRGEALAAPNSFLGTARFLKRKFERRFVRPRLLLQNESFDLVAAGLVRRYVAKRPLGSNSGSDFARAILRVSLRLGTRIEN